MVHSPSLIGPMTHNIINITIWIKFNQRFKNYRPYYLSYTNGNSFSNKNSYLHKMTSKLMVICPWQIILYFWAHDPSSWVSLRKLWELWFEGPKSMFHNAPQFIFDKRNLLLGMTSPTPWSLTRQCVVDNIW